MPRTATARPLKELIDNTTRIERQVDVDEVMTIRRRNAIKALLQRVNKHLNAERRKRGE